ncbi:hypothetical protein V8F20_008192 [Naviculisporaceae sp. PSN 640]
MSTMEWKNRDEEHFISGLDDSVGIPVLVIAGVYGALVLLFIAIFTKALPRSKTHPLRKDGCVLTLCILGSVLAALLWPIGLPAFLTIRFCTEGRGRTCCGMSLAEKSGDLEAAGRNPRAAGVMEAVVDRPPPSYHMATASGEGISRTTFDNSHYFAFNHADCIRLQSNIFLVALTQPFAMEVTPTPQGPGQTNVFLGFLPPQYRAHFIFLVGMEILSLSLLTPTLIFFLYRDFQTADGPRRPRLWWLIPLCIIVAILIPPIFYVFFFPLAIILLIDSYRMRRAMNKLRKEGIQPEEVLQGQATLMSVLARHALNTGQNLSGERTEGDQPPPYDNLSLPLADRARIEDGTPLHAHTCQCGPVTSTNDVDPELGRSTTCHCYGAEQPPAYPDQAYLAR